MFNVDQAFWLFILYLIPFALVGILVTFVLLKICKVQINKTVAYLLSICVLIAFFIIVLLAKIVDDYRQHTKAKEILTIEEISTEEPVVSIETEPEQTEEELRRIVEEANRIKTNR